MRLIPFSSLTDADLARFKQVQLVATDMDGTLTTQGTLTASLLQALEQLAAAEIPVVIVTGRSAGWMSGLVQYLPVFGAIAENGGVFFPRHSDISWSLVNITNLSEHRQQLAHLFQQLRTEWPLLQETPDNRYRLTDWTFDIEGITQVELEQIRDRCQQQGWSFTYSTVQCHIKLPDQNKAAGLLRVVNKYFPTVPAANVMTVGDSPNDETLFAADIFPVSVGVANVLDYRDRLLHSPAYVTQQPEGQGFCELAHRLLTIHQAPPSGP